MHIEEKHDTSADEVAAIERRLYEHNCQASGFSDGKDLGFVARDKDGNIIGAALGYSWGGISELKQLWVAEPSRGRGLGSALLDKFVTKRGSEAHGEFGWRAVTFKRLLFMNARALRA